MPQLTHEDIERLVESWSFPGWRFTYLATGGRLARNRGVPCIEFGSDGTNLLNAQVGPRAPGVNTLFQMEARFTPESRLEARQIVFDLIRWVMIHEAGEYFKEDGITVFDPHMRSNEHVLYERAIPVPWREGE